MLPMMCDQLPCMNMAVRIVIQCWPAVISAGVTDHRVTKASPPASSRTNTKALAAMIRTVVMGVLIVLRLASESGIMPPMASSYHLRN
jgi:hypothetical protein